MMNLNLPVRLTRLPGLPGLLILLVLAGLSCKGAQESELDLGSRVLPVPADHRMWDPDYQIWGASVVKGDEGLYHMYYSRWPNELGHWAWVTSSEIAYAVADRPEGPYRHVNVALPARGKEYWDGTTTHNPTAFRHQGKYFLYYMGCTSDVEARQPTTMKDSIWWRYRNKQRIGMAVADHPEGPWKRLDHPVLDVGSDPEAFDALMTSNPAVNVGRDGQIILLYKAVDHSPVKNGIERGSKVRFLVAFADDPEGPFRKHPDPIFEKEDGPDSYMLAEDPFVWYSDDCYYAITRDPEGRFTGDKQALALMQSENGTRWEAAAHPLVVASHFLFADGTLSDSNLERPQLLFEDGEAAMLFGAFSMEIDGVHRARTCNVFVPFKPTK